MSKRMPDIGYCINLFQYPIQCRTSLSQSDIGDSDIRLSPILLITDIGLGAHGFQGPFLSLIPPATTTRLLLAPTAKKQFQFFPFFQ
jgi:hypothetical protein